jgi:hypothetical protein
MKRDLTDFNGDKLNKIELKTVFGGIDPPKDFPPSGGVSTPPLGNI